MTRTFAIAGLAGALLLAASSFGDTGAPPPLDDNPLLDHAEDARDTAAVAFEAITGSSTADGDPSVNRELRASDLPADPGALPPG